MRTWTNSKIEKKFLEDVHSYVNATYEWDYYLSRLFEDAGVIDIEEGEVIFHRAKALSGNSREILFPLQKNFRTIVIYF